MEERLVTGDFQPEDSAVETTLRPHTLREYVGQQAVKDSLSIYIQAALTRHDALDHMLLYGPPGLGKTTLATIVAAEMGQNIRVTSGRRLSVPATSRQFWRTSIRGTCCSSTKFTASPARWRRCCTPRWRTLPSTS